MISEDEEPKITVAVNQLHKLDDADSPDQSYEKDQSVNE